MTLHNLTPHPIRLYSPETPDRIDPADHEPHRVIDRSTDHLPARLAEHLVEDGPNLERAAIGWVEYGDLTQPLPTPEDGTWYIVPLVVALALARDERGDLLVPYREVRNLDGTVIGCRMLARPV